MNLSQIISTYFSYTMGVIIGLLIGYIHGARY